MADEDRVGQVKDTLKKMQKNLECPICLELLSDPYTTQCGHPFCRICIYTVISSNRQAKCPLCKESISKRSMNENSRLGEIVEAVKQLEQAFIKDTGIPRSPPLPFPPHSYEATDSPGINLHSKIHPSPRKKSRPRSKRTKDDVSSSASTSSQAVLNTLSSTAPQEPTAVDTREIDATKCDISKPAGEKDSGHGKLSIKRRRKKVKFSVEKPTALIRKARKVPAGSPEMENVASSSRNLLSMFAEEEERMDNGNGRLEATSEQAGLENWNGNMEEIHEFGSRNEDEIEGACCPARKKARLDSSSPVKINTISSREVPCSSQQLGNDISCVLETPAPQLKHSNLTVSINRVILLNRFKIQPEFDSNKPNETGREEKNRKNALNHIDSSQPVLSTKLCPCQDMATVGSNHRPQPIASVSMTETPFIRVRAPGLSSGSSSSSVTKIMETPFINNIQAPSDDEEIITNPRAPSDGDDVEQCESILADETEIVIECDNNRTVSSEDQSQMEKAENLLSDSILVKETQDADQNDQPSSDHNRDDSLATDDSCTVLGPTPITSVPESQFTRSASTLKPRAASHVCQSPPQIVDDSASFDSHTVEGEQKMPTQQDPRTSSGSESSGTCSPVQSGGTTCIGETQFTKSESKLSPDQEERQTTTVTVPPTGMTMPSPPQASPTYYSEIQSPIIPLQNSSTHHRHDLFSHSGSSAVQVSQQQQSSGTCSVSKIAETQFISSNNSNRGDIVPSSQPSPSASKRQSAASLLKLPGLKTVQYRKPQPQATMMTDGRVSLEKNEKGEINSESQVLAVRQSEEEGGALMKLLSKSLTVEQNQNSEHTVETTIATERSPTQSTGGGACVMGVPLSSMSLAYSSLQSQRANLQSQISSSLDLSSQQLELLRLEMEEKQREIDELEAALKQVEEEEKESIQPGGSPVTSTQSSVRSITIIAETMPESSSTCTCSGAGQMVSPPNQVSSPEHSAPAGSIENPLSGGLAKTNTAIIADNVEAILSSREASPERMDVYASESIENPLSGQTKSLECFQVAVISPDHASVRTIPSSLVVSSQFAREQSSMNLSQIRASTSNTTLSSQELSNESTTTKFEAVTRIAPNIHQMETAEGEKSAQHQNQIPNVTSEDLHVHEPTSRKSDFQSVNAARSSNLSKTTPSLHSETEHDAESDASTDGETPPCTSQSVLATLQAADDILRKLRSPPLVVLEERSSMEIDTDLYHSSGTPDASHKQSLKAKKLHVPTDAAKPSGVSDKAQTALIVIEKDATLEVDDQLCTGSAKEAVSAKRGKRSTSASRGKRVHSASSKSKSKKTKKAPLLVYESEDVAVVTRSQSRNQAATKSPSSDNIFTSAKSSEISHLSSPALSSIKIQSPDIAQCSREGGRGSTTPTCRGGRGEAVCHQTPKAQCSSNSGTTAASSISEDGGGGVGNEAPAVSPCRPLSRVGKDHPPSYIGSGLSKTQLREVQSLARRYGGRLASCFNGSTSHVIVSADENGLCPRTIKYLQGVATGRWIISYQWITESLNAGRLLSESKFEIVGDHVTTAITRAPMRSRQLHLEESPGLFADYAFLFIGVFGGLSQDHLAQLIQLSGGTLISSMEESTTRGSTTTCVVCDEEKFTQLQLPSGCGLVRVKSGWILDCLSNYSILPISSSQ